MAGCDCYVSLHRSEGFGLTMAEAMWLAKPTIATAYARNGEFMTPTTAACSSTMTPVGEGSRTTPRTRCGRTPDVEDAAEAMRWAFENREEAAEIGRRGARDVRAAHAPEIAGEEIERALAPAWERAAQGAGRLRKAPAGEGSALVEATPDAVNRARGLLALDAVPERPGAGRMRQGLRGLLGRLLRPHTSYQRKIDEMILDAFDELVRRLAELEARLAEARAEPAFERAALLAEMRRIADRVEHETGALREAVAHREERRDQRPRRRRRARARACRRFSPPGFEEVPEPDVALFLCAIDHRTGYRGSYMVGGKGPFEGSVLLWRLGLRAESRRAGLLSAAELDAVDAGTVAEIFRIGGETAAGPQERAALWRDLAVGLERSYEGSAEALLAAAEGRLGGSGGLIGRLSEFDAFSDPLNKKALLFAKIAERRGWLAVADPEQWQVCADNVLMRLALRSGLVPTGPRDEVRTATRDAFKRIAGQVGISPPVLDDLLWEQGRDDPDLLGTAGGDLREPERDPESAWY